MFGLDVLPALTLLGGMVFLPESPRWLLVRKRDDEASSTLERMRGNRAAALAEVAKIRTVVRDEPEAHWRDLARPWVRPAVIVGASLSMFSQITGNNALIYYAPTILTTAGFSDKGGGAGNGPEHLAGGDHDGDRQRAGRST